VAESWLDERIGILFGALGESAPATHSHVRCAELVRGKGDAGIWLALAVIRAELPTPEELVGARRSLRLAGDRAFIQNLAKHVPPRLKKRSVEVVSDRVVVDVQHTAKTGLATGIQRVARNTILRWSQSHDILLVGWNDAGTAMRRLNEAEQQNALHGGAPQRGATDETHVIVPWQTVYLLPELATESERTRRIQALAGSHSNRSGVIGFDTVPLTSAETVGPGMSTAFAKNLRAVAEMDAVAAISRTAATEYSGWAGTLVGIGTTGPDVRAVPLPEEYARPDDAAIEATRAEFAPDGLPLLLCVGSHEPRKNHLAVLAAAELLWQAGREFRLLFVGGNAWRSEGFEHEVALLRERGRAVELVSRLSDDSLSAAYAIASCTVFPSVNEGWGLPVSESLAAGTPAVTSDFGSMREIGAGGGAVLVNPRDDDAIARGIDEAMFDGRVNARLRREASARPRRTWDEYAEEVWAVLVTGVTG